VEGMVSKEASFSNAVVAAEADNSEMTEMTGMIAVVAAENSKRKDIRPD